MVFEFFMPKFQFEIYDDLPQKKESNYDEIKKSLNFSRVDS